MIKLLWYFLWSIGTKIQGEPSIIHAMQGTGHMDRGSNGPFCLFKLRKSERTATIGFNIGHITEASGRPTMFCAYVILIIMQTCIIHTYERMQHACM